MGRFISEDSVADDPNLYGYCGQNPVNFTDPTGHFSVGLQSGFRLFSAAVNAVAILSGDSNLSVAISCFNMFIAIKSSIQIAQIKKAITEAATTDQPAPDPVETAENASIPTDNALESGSQGEETGNNAATSTTTSENAPSETKPVEAKKLTIEELKADIAEGKIDLTQSIDTLMKQYNVPPEQALEVIKAAVSHIVSKLPRTTATDPSGNQVELVEMPYDKVLGLFYIKQVGTLCSWGRPEFVEKIMTIGLYWNHLHPNSYIAFNDLSRSDLKPVTYPNGKRAHSSHQKGRQIDFDIIWNGSSVTDVKRAKAGTTNSVYIKGDPNYLSRNKAIIKDFFKMVNSVYPATFNDVLWCDTSVSSLVNKKINSNQYLRWSHANHIHMGF